MSAQGSVAELPPITITNSPFLSSRRWQDEDIRNASAQGKCMKMRRENHVMVKTAMTIASKVRPHDNMIVTYSYTRYYSY
jgi:hypothetical protein